MFTDVGGGVL